MSQFDSALNLATDLEPPARRFVVNAITEANQAKVTPAIADKRAVKRMSIEELNSLDVDTLREKMRVKYDDRTPLIKFLDLIDMPRNTVAGLLAPSLRRKAEAEGETGTFGMGKVYGSDVLKSLGVDNRIARGVLGFALDVAFDPLTYVGAAPVTKMANASGQAARISRTGMRALRGGIEAAATGAAVRDATVARLIESAGYTTEKLNELRKTGGDKAVRDELATALLGSAKGDRKRIFLDKAGFDTKTPGGLIAESFGKSLDDSVDAVGKSRIEASREFVRKYGKGGEGIKGITFGDGGSQVAHIPFTDIGINVPAFTAEGRMARTQQAIAKAGKYVGDAKAPLGAASVAKLQFLTEAEKRTADVIKQSDELHDINEILRKDALYPDSDPMAHVIAEGMAIKAKENLAAKVAEADAEFTRLADSLPGDVAEAGAPKTVEEALFQGRKVEEARTRLEHLKAQREAIEHEETLRQDFQSQVRQRASAEIADTRKMEGVYENPMTRGWMDPATQEKVKPFTEDADKAIADIQAKHRAAMLAEVQRKDEGLYRLLSRDPAEVEALGVATQRAYQSGLRYAMTVDGSLRSVLSAGQKDLLDATKYALGTTDDIIAASSLAGFRAATEALGQGDDSVAAQFLSAASRSKRSAFGQRSGELHQVVRLNKWARGEGSQIAMAERVNSVIGSLRKIATEHGISHDAVDDLGTLLTAMVVDKAAKAGAYFDTTLEGMNPAWKEAILGAMNKGLLDESLPGRAGIIGKLQALADENADLLKTMGDAAFEDELIGKVRPGYLPNLMTDEARRAESSNRGIFGKKATQPSGPTNPVSANEAFQRARSTDEFRFTNAAGEEKSFFEWERGYKTYSKDRLTYLKNDDPKLWAEIQEKLATIDEYDQMLKQLGLNEVDGQRMFSRATDPFTLNQMVKAGTFATLTGGKDLPRGFFETNLAMLMGQRQAAQMRAAAKAGMLERLKPLAIQVKSGIRDVAQKGGVHEFRTSGGTLGQMFKEGDDVIFRIGDQRYRVLNQGKFQGDAAKIILDPLTEGQAFEALLPEQAVQELERMADAVRDPSQLMRAVEQMTVAWKGSTLLHPSWMINDTIGGTILAIQLGAKADKLAKFARPALQMVMHAGNSERLKKITAEVFGRAIDGEAAMNDAVSHLVARAGKYSEPLVQLKEMGMLNMPNEYALLKNPGLAFKESWHRALTNANIGGKVFKAATAKQKLAAMKNMVWDEGVIRRVMAPWFKANEIANDWMRLTTYLALMDERETAASAAARVRRGMFDFGDFTPMEDDLRRTVFPFYSWVRNNGAYQASYLFENPKFAAAFPKVKEAIEEMAAGDAQIPDHVRPTWMREQLAIQLGADPESRFALTAMTSFPQEQLFNLGAGAMGLEGMLHLGKYIGSNVGPALRLPAEAAFGRELFTGREIGGDATQGDISLPAYALGQVRWLKEFGVGDVRTGPVPRAFERGVGQGLARATMGGKIQPMDADYVNARRIKDFRNAEDKIRKAIAVAEFNSNAKASMEARAELMRLYAFGMQAGLTDSVPKWAQNQLEILQGKPVDMTP